MESCENDKKIILDLDIYLGSDFSHQKFISDLSGRSNGTNIAIMLVLVALVELPIG